MAWHYDLSSSSDGLFLAGHQDDPSVSMKACTGLIVSRCTSQVTLCLIEVFLHLCCVRQLYAVISWFNFYKGDVGLFKAKLLRGAKQLHARWRGAN